jgi:Phosphotransferase enzyme family
VSNWADPEWRAEADAWIERHVASVGASTTGKLDLVHVRPWSTVIRVPTTIGDLFFKANAASLRHEAAVTQLLAERRPDCTIELQAVDTERGWMLMADAGRPLREIVAEERSLDRWLDVLPLYGSVQVGLSDDADVLVALGVPDLRLAVLPETATAMLDALDELAPDEFPLEERLRLRAALSVVGERCAELAAYGVPETIQHDDFHDGQVFAREGRYLLLDWADACVTHPFFTLAVTLEGGIAWGVDDIEGSVDTAPFRDAYLDAFAGLAAEEDLVAAAAIATRLGWLCRAVNGHQSGNEARERTLVRLRMFLDGRA